MKERPIVHPLIVRVTHWTNAFAVIVMIMSGWRIYNASPIFDFIFPPGFTLGGWLAGALAWHFAAMWLLVVNATIFAVYAILSGHLRRSFFPISLREAARDIMETKHLFTRHRPGQYNSAQKLIYLGLFAAMIIAIISGAAIWKPVQWQTLTAIFGGYDAARRVHFFAMAFIAAFVFLHVVLALTVQGVLTPMVTGRLETRRK